MTRNVKKFKDFQKFFQKYLLKNFGKKCPDYCSDCVMCRVWRTYEDFTALVAEIEELEKN